MTVAVGRIGHISSGRRSDSDLSHSARFKVEAKVEDSYPDRAGLED